MVESLYKYEHLIFMIFFLFHFDFFLFMTSPAFNDGRSLEETPGERRKGADCPEMQRKTIEGKNIWEE